MRNIWEIVKIMAKKARILIVEDEESQRLLYQVELEQEGFSIKTAATTAEADRIIDQWKPDLIIVDIQLPDTNGIEWMSMVVNRWKIPCIIHSAYSHYKDNFASWAAEDYIVKSSNLDDLKEAVKRVLKKRKKTAGT